MSTIKFSNGTKVNFNGNPTQQDVEEIATKLGLHSPTPPPIDTTTTNNITPQTYQEKQALARSQAGQDISGAFNSGINQIKEGWNQMDSNYPIGLFEGAAKTGAGIVNTALSPTAPIFKPISQGINYVGDKINDIPAVQKFSLSKGGEITRRVSNDILNLNTIAGAVTGIKNPSETVNSFTNAVDTGISKIGETFSRSPAEQAVINHQTNISSATKDLTPNYDPKLIQEPDIKNPNGTSIPRVMEGKGTSGRTVNLNKQETAAVQELANTKSYNPKATILEKYQKVLPEIKQINDGVVNQLEKSKIPVPRQEVLSIVNKTLKNVPSESLLIAKTDPVITNYLRVLKNALSKNDGTLAGEFRVKQIMDLAYKNARGKMAFGSDKIAPLDEIHYAAREAIKADVITRAKRVGIDVSSALKSETNLYKARDILLTKAEQEGGTGIDRLMQNHPIMTRVIKHTPYVKKLLH